MLGGLGATETNPRTRREEEVRHVTFGAGKLCSKPEENVYEREGSEADGVVVVIC